MGSSQKHENSLWLKNIRQEAGGGRFGLWQQSERLDRAWLAFDARRAATLPDVEAQVKFFGGLDNNSERNVWP